MKLVTSIPPRFSRTDPATGAEIGRRHLEDCIVSWRRNGFEPISINRPDEVDAVRGLDLIEVVPAPQEEAREPGRYGPCLGSIFDLLAPDDPVAIVNADIYMLSGPNVARQISQLASKSLLAARRTDVPSMSARDGKTYPFGYDLFAFTPGRIPKTISDPNIRRFQLGAPWWDYVFPIRAANEVPASRITEPFIIHLDHEERWNIDLHERLAAEVGRTLAAVHEVFDSALQLDGPLADPISGLCHRLLFFPGFFERRIELDNTGHHSTMDKPYWL